LRLRVAQSVAEVCFFLPVLWHRIILTLASSIALGAADLALGPSLIAMQHDILDGLYIVWLCRAVQGFF